MLEPVEWTVQADRGRVVPWRNRLGTTRELTRSPDGAGEDDWTWRVSIATSDDPAAFSTFEGVDRELLVLSGPMLELRFGDGRTVRLLPEESHRFAGEVAVTGVPVGGPTEQLNLMWRRDRVRGAVLPGPPLRVQITPVDSVETRSPGGKQSD